MKKEFFVAIIIGFVIGAAVAISAIRLPTLLQKAAPKPIEISKDNNLPTGEVKRSPLAIEIESPTDESIQTNKSVTVKGKIIPPATIVFETYLDSVAFEAPSSGSFSVDVDLIEGSNKILITGYTADGDSDAKELILFYTAEKL